MTNSARESSIASTIPPEFLWEILKLRRQVTKEPLLVRLDSGNDAAENIRILLETGCYFIIKRNLRCESQEDWYNMEKEYSPNAASLRKGKTVYIGSDCKTVSWKVSDSTTKNATIRAGYEVIERTIDKYGQFLLPADIEANTWWTNTGMSDNEIIGHYHAHRECEQFHSKIKSDMNVKRLPSGKFATNKLILELAILTYNILRMIGQETIGRRTPKAKHKVRRRRLHTAIGDLIMMVCHVMRHAHQLIMRLRRSNPWKTCFAEAYTAFSDFLQQNK